MYFKFDPLIDTHTHLYVEAFDKDRDLTIQNAISKGVTDFYIPAIDSKYHQRMFDLEKNYPDYVHLMMGLHPTHVKENFKEELIPNSFNEIEDQINKD